MTRKPTNAGRGAKPPLPEPIDTSEFDREFVIDSFRPLTAEERARWERVRAKGEKADEAAEIAVRVASDLLTRADGLAERMGITRDCLIARGLRAVLAAEGEL